MSNAAVLESLVIAIRRLSTGRFAKSLALIGDAANSRQEIDLIAKQELATLIRLSGADSAANASAQLQAISTHPQTGDLCDDLIQAGKAANRKRMCLVILIDDVDQMDDEAFCELLAGLHRCNQLSLPVLLVCFGGELARAKIGDAKPYAERLFDFFVAD